MIERVKLTAAETIRFAGSSYVDPNGGWAFKCTDCGEFVRQMDVEDHVCGED